MGCCLHCKFAASYYINLKGEKIKSHKSWFRLMNIYCNHPEIGTNGQCLPISWGRCNQFQRMDSESIQKRVNFYSQFPAYQAHKSIISQRGGL